MSPVGGRSSVARWWRSLRAFSFSASLVPVALAAAIVLGRGLDAQWWTFPLYALAAVLFHAATNVLNDYFDWRNGVDGAGDPDPTHAISQGVASPRFMAVSGHVYFFAAILLGSVIALERGPLFFGVGIAGALGSYFYTGARFSLKYVALGDPAVFLLMGPLLVVIGVWALTGGVPSFVVAESLPIAFLVTAILHANNLRDLERDRAAGVRTIANLIGERASRALFALLLLAPYATVVVLVAVGAVGAPILATLVTMPLAYRPLRRVLRRSREDGLIDLPLRCALLHLAFGVVYVAAVFVA